MKARIKPLPGAFYSIKYQKILLEENMTFLLSHNGIKLPVLVPFGFGESYYSYNFRKSVSN